MQRSQTTPTVLQSDTKVEVGKKTEKGSRILSLIDPLFAPVKVGGEGVTGRSISVSSDMKVRLGKGEVVWIG